MKKTSGPLFFLLLRELFLVWLIAALLILLDNLPSFLDKKQFHHGFRSFSGGFPSQQVVSQQTALDKTLPTPTSNPKNKEKTIERRFNWVYPENTNRQTLFHIHESFLKEEIRHFGVSPHSTAHPFILEKKGFKVIGRQNIMRNQEVVQRLLSIVDYQQIYQRNLPYFKVLTHELMTSIALATDDDPLPPFLSFVQYIRYEQPPLRYRGKFINSFFVPVVCLYEQFGDCDSKSLLLSVFLATVPGFEQRTAIILIRSPGISHAVLAINRKPLPGMFSFFDYQKGYYVLLETTKPNWYIGFTSQRVLEAIKAGYYNVVELN